MPEGQIAAVPDAATIESVRRQMYSWRMWRNNPSTTEMVAAQELLCRRPQCEKLADIHYVIWQQDFHEKRLRKGERAESKKAFESLRKLTASDLRLWGHIKTHRARLHLRTLAERLALVAMNPTYNSFEEPVSAVAVTYAGGYGAGSAPPPRA